MLEVVSPVPMTEGETLVAGLRTRHLLHFFTGVLFSTPVMALAYGIAPLLGVSRFLSLGIGAGIGLWFATTTKNGRSVAEILWLSIRFYVRPKLFLYDRTYRIRVHREEVGKV
ncbi:hypothetical protein ACOJUR_15710 [Alicyclobacillus tolerans]|uniref:hypothetical protein n=1 Tax=Alicyclobacillus tolerans TaxID=90970 RepID=UPI003B7B5A47